MKSKRIKTTTKQTKSKIRQHRPQIAQIILVLVLDTENRTAMAPTQQVAKPPQPWTHPWHSNGTHAWHPHSNGTQAWQHHTQACQTCHPAMSPSNRWHLAMAPQQWHLAVAPSNGTYFYKTSSYYLQGIPTSVVAGLPHPPHSQTFMINH